MEQNQFPKLWDMAKEAFVIYKQKILQIFLISFLAVIVNLVIAFLAIKSIIPIISSNFTNVDALIGQPLILILAIIPFSCFFNFILLTIFIKRNNNLSFMDIIKDVLSKFFPMLWIGIISALAVIFGFILFIIPGIIFMIWFVFSGSILIDQGISGVAALKKSKQYVSGLMGKIFEKIIGIIFFTIIFGIVISFLPDMIENIVMVAFTNPMMTIIMVLLYERVKQIKEQNQTPQISI